MNKVEILKTIAGVIILIFSITILLMAFSKNGLKALVVLFNFGIDYNTTNLEEFIAAAAASIVAGLFFWIGMIFIGIVYLAICINFGVLTLVLKTSKTVTIIVLIFTSFSMFMEIRAIAILVRAEITSGILIAHLFGDIVVAGICVYSIIILYGFPDQLK